MPLTGKQKAARLLMGLDAATAAELLKGIDTEMVQELAVELAYLDATGYQGGKQGTQIARQFCNSLRTDQKHRFKSCLEQMITNNADEQITEQNSIQTKDLQQEIDPFASIRLLDPQTIALVLEKEHPRSVAVVLSELAPEKSSDVIDHLGRGVRFSAVRRMTTCKNMAVETKAQIAKTVCERLKAFTIDDTNGTEPTRLERFTGKIAMIMRRMSKDLRVALLTSTRARKVIAEEIKNEDTSVQKLIPDESNRTNAVPDEQAPNLLNPEGQSC